MIEKPCAGGSLDFERDWLPRRRRVSRVEGENGDDELRDLPWQSRDPILDRQAVGDVEQDVPADGDGVADRVTEAVRADDTRGRVDCRQGAGVRVGDPERPTREADRARAVAGPVGRHDLARLVALEDGAL